jgi:hypothetical protein
MPTPCLLVSRGSYITKEHAAWLSFSAYIYIASHKKMKQKSKWAKPRAASRAQMKKRGAIERDGTGPAVFNALWGRARKIDSNHRAALRRYEHHSLLTDVIFQFKLELTKVGKDVRAHPWWKRRGANATTVYLQSE